MFIQILTLHVVVMKKLSDFWVFDVVIILTCLALVILGLNHLVINKGRSQVWVEQEFIVSYFGEFLDDLDKVVVIDVDSARVGDQDESGAKLPDLIKKKIFDDIPDEIALVIFNILFIL